VSAIALLQSPGAGTAAAQPPTTTATTSAIGSNTSTTTAPRHVVNQPNLNALSPHINALAGPGVQYQHSGGPSDAGGDVAGVPSFMSAPGGPYFYDADNGW
jgi:hypothetical protein